MGDESVTPKREIEYQRAAADKARARIELARANKVAAVAKQAYDKAADAERQALNYCLKIEGLGEDDGH